MIATREKRLLRRQASLLVWAKSDTLAQGGQFWASPAGSNSGRHPRAAALRALPASGAERKAALVKCGPQGRYRRWAHTVQLLEVGLGGLSELFKAREASG